MIDRFAKPRRPSRELERATSPVGLGQLPLSQQPSSVVRSVCGFCSTGCSLDLHIVDGEAANVTPSPDYPVNAGSACPKGWEALRVLDSPDRAVQPLVRNALGELEPASWSHALDEFVTEARRVQSQHGDDSFAFISTGQIATEEMALLGALAKFGMGMKHGDGNTRQCMATSVVAYKQAFGFDAPPYTYADFDESDVIVLVGSNLAIAHPIMWERVLRNPHHPNIVVIDPRFTETASAASQHLALTPDSDLVLFYGLANQLIAMDALDHSFIVEHTNGFDHFATHVSAFDLATTAEATGLTVEQLELLASTIANGQRVSFWWTMGVNQSHQGVRTAQAIINLALMTGNIGRPGTGANSVTGQCNAMGSRLFSNTTNLLGGYDFAKPDDRSHVGNVLGIDPEVIPAEGSWAYDQILDGIERGDILALWVIATNTAHSWIDQNNVRDTLAKLDLLVVQDMYTSTETAELADIVLPAAGWGEKDGTFINSERRIGHITKARTAPGQALADFWIFKAVAHAWGCNEMFDRWESPEATFALLCELSAGQPCDFSGISGYDQLEAAGGIQWPYPAGAQSRRLEFTEDPNQDWSNQRRLFGDGRFYTVDGRARFLVEDPAPVAEQTSPDFPLVLLTGRGNVADWHTRTRTSKSPVLASLVPSDPYVEMHPADAAELAVESGTAVEVASKRGSLTAAALVTTSVQPGQVFMPMHFATANQLTNATFDPYSRQPAYKNCAVSVRAIPPWSINGA